MIDLRFKFFEKKKLVKILNPTYRQTLSSAFYFFTHKFRNLKILFKYDNKRRIINLKRLKAKNTINELYKRIFFKSNKTNNIIINDEVLDCFKFKRKC